MAGVKSRPDGRFEFGNSVPVFSQLSQKLNNINFRVFVFDFGKSYYLFDSRHIL